MRKKLRTPIWALLELNDCEQENRFHPSLEQSTNESSMSGIEFLEREELIPNEKHFVFPAAWWWNQQGG